MFICRSIFILLCLFLGSIRAEASVIIKHIKQKGSQKDTLLVMTYNVHHCNPPGKATQGLIDITAIANAIQREQPDLVALQEIDDHTTRSGKNINEAEEIAKILGMHYYFGKAIDYAGGGYGVAILSKFPISEMKTMFLTKEADTTTEQRVLATVRVSLPNGKSIRFACTHLDVVNAANRSFQVNEITQTAIHDSIPFLLGGDMNEKPLNKPIQLLDENFTRNCIQCEPTFPQDIPVIVIDYIAYFKSSPFQFIKQWVSNETYASDHRPVMAKMIVQ